MSLFLRSTDGDWLRARKNGHKGTMFARVTRRKMCATLVRRLAESGLVGGMARLRGNKRVLSELRISRSYLNKVLALRGVQRRPAGAAVLLFGRTCSCPLGIQRSQPQPKRVSVAPR